MHYTEASLYEVDASIWQLIKLELLCWIIFYLAINQTYHFFLKGTKSGVILVSLVNFIKQRESTIMLPFLLAFGYNIASFYEWPDSFASSLTAHLRTSSSRLSEEKVQILPPMMARFPTYESLSEKGVELLNEQELKMLNSIDNKLPKKWCKYWVPFQWLLFMMKNKYAYLHVVQELIKYRSRMGDILSYDFVASPILAFTQAIVFAVYGYVFFSAFSRQVLDGPYSYLQIIFPVFEVLIYLSWIKCTLIMINPFGLDRDDFELEWLTARHWRVIYLTMDEPWKFFPLSTFTKSCHRRRQMPLDDKLQMLKIVLIGLRKQKWAYQQPPAKKI
uniref:Bestrophin homolog n=1 Tax=Ditylenchus dipsaci TaxID=166011 RepID=A0A915CTK5_9BILA